MFSTNDFDRSILEGFNNSETIHDIVSSMPSMVSTIYKKQIYHIDYNMSYSAYIANTHSAPITGVENFTRDENLPLHYAGYIGTMTVHIEKDGGFAELTRYFSGSGKDSIKGINFGSGGGGGSVLYMNSNTRDIATNISILSYQCTVFIDDFPNLKKNTERLIWLSGLKHLCTNPSFSRHYKKLKDIKGSWVLKGHSLECL